MRILGDLSRLAARRMPEKVALLNNEAMLTYGEIDRASNRLAHGFVAAGVEKGDRIALIASNHPAYVIPAQAAAKCGAIIVPLNHRYAVAELAEVLRRAEPRILVCDDGIADTVVAALPASGVAPLILRLLDNDATTPGMGAFSAAFPSTHGPAVAVSPDDPATIMFTSGTTGKPKGVLYGHGAHFQLFDGEALELSITSRDVLHISSALYTNAGINGGINTMMMVGGQGVIHNGPFAPERILADVERFGVTISFWVPTMLEMLATLMEDGMEACGYDLSNLRSIFYGSMPMNAAVYQRSHRLLPHVRFYQLYGSTECGFAGVLPPEEHDGSGRTARPAYNTDLAIVDADGSPVAEGEVGEIRVHNATAGMMGYWRDEDATAEAIRDGWIGSGDLARQEAGGYFTLVDRVRDMIISGAHNIYCAEVEGAIQAHPGVREVAVFGIPDQRYGEIVCAAIALHPDAIVTAAELDAHCLERLARYKRPRRFDFHADLPRNSNGKLVKRQLRDPYWEGQGRGI